MRSYNECKEDLELAIDVFNLVPDLKLSDCLKSKTKLMTIHWIVESWEAKEAIKKAFRNEITIH